MRTHPTTSRDTKHSGASTVGIQKSSDTYSSAYGATIETPKVVSVASLRASFNSRGTNQPLMPMNSTDPRVRQKMSTPVAPPRTENSMEKPSWRKSANTPNMYTPPRSQVHEPRAIPKSAPPASKSSFVPSPGRVSNQQAVSAFWEDRQVSRGKTATNTERAPVKAPKNWQTEPSATKQSNSSKVVVTPPNVAAESFPEAMRSKWQSDTENMYAQRKFSKTPWQQDTSAAKQSNEHRTMVEWRQKRDGGLAGPEGQLSPENSVRPDRNDDDFDPPPLGPVILPQGNGAGSTSRSSTVELKEDEVPLGPVILPQKEQSKREPTSPEAKPPVSAGAVTQNESPQVIGVQLLPAEMENTNVEEIDKMEGSSTDRIYADTSNPSNPAQHNIDPSEKSMVSSRFGSMIEEKKSSDSRPLDEDDAVLLDAALSVDDEVVDSPKILDGSNAPLYLMGTESGLIGDFDAAMEYASRPMPSGEEDSFLSGIDEKSSDFSGRFQKALLVSNTSTTAVQPKGASVDDSTSRYNLTIKQSDSTSVYIEDDQEKLDSTADLSNPRGQVGEQHSMVNQEKIPTSIDKTASARFRIGPSPKDNGAYRRGYFGEDTFSPAGKGQQSVNNDSDLGSSKDETEKSSIAHKSDQKRYIGALESPAHDEHSRDNSSRMSSTLVGSYPDEMLDDADQWMDKDPDFGGFADDDSLSQGEPVVTATKKVTIVSSTEPERQRQVKSFGSSSFSWNEPEPTPQKREKKKKKKNDEVFDPFAEDDDEKVENSENLFSPAQDPFMTEESFSPLDWGTPRAIHYSADSQSGHSGFEI